MSRLPPPFGPFHPVRRLGAGGMAETFVAVRRGPGGFAQNVCIKRILPSFESDVEFVESFLAEARLSAALRHANIVQVLDFGLADDSHYLALELIDGLDLRALLGCDSDQRLVLEPDCAALIAADVAAALEHAHSDAPGRPSVVHRDVSPSNVLVSTAGEVKLTDFGIARATSGRGRTATGIIKGKVPYMPPEYIERSQFDPRGDLFSLGVMMYEVLAGQRPFDGHSDIDTIRRIVAGHHVHLGGLVQGAPPQLIQCIERLLAVRPDDRYPSARVFLEALPPVATHRVRRRLGELVRERMQELKVEAPSAPPEPPRRSAAPHAIDDAAYRATDAASYVPDSRIDRLPHTHTRDPVILSEPSIDTRPRQRGPSSRALWTLAASGALLAVVVALVLTRLPELTGAQRAAAPSTAPSEALGTSAQAAPKTTEPAPSPRNEDDWRHTDTVQAAPSAPQPYGANPGAADPDRPIVTAQPSGDDGAGIVAAPGLSSAAPMPDPAPPQARPHSSRPRPSARPQAESNPVARPQPSGDGQLAELRIIVQPFGDVWVDGKRLGQAPVSINVEAGTHEVAVGDGRPKERRNIQLSAGQHERLEIVRRDLAENGE
jgi:serine/threonine protein kinase